MNWRDKTGLGFEEGEGKKRREELGRRSKETGKRVHASHARIRYIGF